MRAIFLTIGLTTKLIGSVAISATLSVNEVKVENQGVVANPSATSRTLNLKFHACTNAKTTEVSIKPGDISTKTDAKGCMKWTAPFIHKIYQPQGDQLIFMSIQVKSSGEKVTIPIFVNPFSNDPKFAVDGRFISAERKNQKPLPGPFLQVPSVLAQFSGTNFEIDAALDVTFIRRYSISFGPEVVRPDNQSLALNQPERLRDGQYLIRASLFLGDENLADSNVNPKLIDSFEKVVTVSGSRIQTQIEFRSHDLIVWGGRNSISFEIYPTDADGKNIDLASGLQPRTFWGSFAPSNELSNIIVAKVDSLPDTQSIMSKKVKEHRALQKALIAEKLKTFNLLSFTAENGLRLLLPRDAKYDQLALEPTYFENLARLGVLKTLYDTSSREKLVKNLRPLCRRIFIEGLKPASPAQYARATEIAMQCEKEPLRLFSLDHKIHVLDSAPRANWLGGRSQSFNVSSSFDLSVGRSLSATLREGTSVGAGASVRPLSLLTNVMSKIPILKDFFSASLDFQWNRDSSRADSLSEGNGHNLSFSRGVYLIEQQAQIEITAKKYRPCLSLLVDQNAMLAIVGDSIEVSDFQGFHFCAEEINSPISFLENYYFFSQHFATGDFIDNRHPNNRPFVLSLRGNRDYFTFLNVTNKLLDVNDPTNKSKISPQDIFLKGAELFSHQQRAYPGSISTFTDARQLEFMLQGETNVKAKDILSTFLHDLSPFTRHQIKPLIQ